MRDHTHAYEERDDGALVCFECDYTRTPKAMVADSVMEASRMLTPEAFESLMADIAETVREGENAGSLRHAAAIALRAARRSPGPEVVSLYGDAVNRELDHIIDDPTGEPLSDDNATIIGGPKP